MGKVMDEYHAALDRLILRGAKISNDAVAIEAGRNKGSIKKSRSQFSDLIAAIDEAAALQIEGGQNPKLLLARAKQEQARLQQRLDECLAREINLVHEVFQLKKQLHQLTTGKVVPLRGRGK
jgi:hypothetical protein